MKITGKLRYESGLTKVLKRKARQLKRKWRRGKLRSGKKNKERRGKGGRGGSRKRWTGDRRLMRRRKKMLAIDILGIDGWGM